MLQSRTARVTATRRTMTLLTSDHWQEPQLRSAFGRLDSAKTGRLPKSTLQGALQAMLVGSRHDSHSSAFGHRKFGRTVYCSMIYKTCLAASVVKQ